MKKPMEQLQEQLAWLTATAHAGDAARFDVAFGDADKRPGHFFVRAGHTGLTAAEILRRSAFYRAANASGVKGKAERPLNIYTKSVAVSQSWTMQDDLTLDQCRRIAGGRTHMIVETSPGRHHLWLASSRTMSVSEREHCQKVLVGRFGCGDKGSMDGDHLGRLAGFKNVKRGCWVNLIDAVITDRRADIDRLLSMPVPFDSHPKGVCASSSPQACASSSPSPQGVRPPAGPPSLVSTVSSAGRDESAAEFGWACGWLKKNLSAADGIARLSQRATDRHKPRPEQYARRTFDAAARCVSSTR